MDYHAHLGVEKFHMHLPIGSHVDALFDADARDTRIKETTKLNERSPESIGRDRVEVFSHPAVTWQKYYGAPTANYYSGRILSNLQGKVIILVARNIMRYVLRSNAVHQFGFISEKLCR